MAKLRTPTKTIKQVITLSAPAPVVFEALANPKIHSVFTSAKATGRTRIGAKVTAHDGYIEGRILEVIPGRKIVQEWKTAEWPEGFPPSHLVWSIVKTARGSRLTMIHSCVPAGQAARYRQGWHEYYWTPLKAYLATRS